MMAIVTIVCNTVLPLTNGHPSVLLSYFILSMQVNMECGKSAKAALGVTASLMVLALAQCQGIGKYFLA